jgi:hypothetical protein
MPEIRKILSEFGRCAQDVSALLERNPQLDLVEQVYIENQLQLVRSAYGAWRRRSKLGDLG